MPSYYYPTKPKPAAPKTTNYTVRQADDGVPISFDTTLGMLTCTLIDPWTVDGATFMIGKDAGVADVIISGFGFMYSLGDISASVVIMARYGKYAIIANYNP